MSEKLSQLFSYERAAVIEALYRDMRNELDRVHTDVEFSAIHRYNAFLLWRICGYFYDSESNVDAV